MQNRRCGTLAALILLVDVYTQMPPLAHALRAVGRDGAFVGYSEKVTGAECRFNFLLALACCVLHFFLRDMPLRQSLEISEAEKRLMVKVACPICRWVCHSIQNVFVQCMFSACSSERTTQQHCGVILKHAPTRVIRWNRALGAVAGCVLRTSCHHCHTL